ncbi:Fasciclin-2-like protein, partial [Leptotrombidium deliense]
MSLLHLFIPLVLLVVTPLNAVDHNKCLLIAIFRNDDYCYKASLNLPSTAWEIEHIRDVFTVEDIAVFVSCRFSRREAKNVTLKWINKSSEKEINESKHVTVHDYNEVGFSILHFKNPKIKHNAIYSCVVTNNGVEKRMSFKVTVLPKFKWIECDAEQYLVKFEDRQKILCSVPKQYFPFISWQKDNETIIESKRIKIRIDGLYMRAPFRSSNVGEYIVTVINKTIGIYEKRKIYVDFLLPPKIKYPTSIPFPMNRNSFEIRVISEGSPKPIIKWFDYKKNKILNNNTDSGIYVNNDILRITNKKYLKSFGKVAEIFCVAQNRKGNSTRIFKIQLFEEPIIMLFESFIISEGSNKTLECNATGFPLPK